MTSALIFLSGLALLYFGGEGLVRGAAAIGMRVGMSPLLAGLTIVAFATSAPELAISVHAAMRGAPGLAVGNIIGSNICNITLILGVTALVAPPRLREILVRRDAMLMILATLLVPGLLLDGELTRAEGSLLTISIVGYVWLSVWHATSQRHIDPFESSTVPILSEHLLINLTVSVASVGLLVLGSELFVRSSISIAMALGVPSAVVGLSAAALATSLPELSACVVAARHGHPEMAAGNLVGSNIFNLLMIPGITSLLRPLSIGGVTHIDLVTMIVTTLLAIGMMLTKMRVDRREGSLLVLVYLGYQYWLLGGIERLI
jgi:cation:H+ antiporter